MGGDEGGDAGVSYEGEQVGDDRAGGGRIEIAGGLVGQQDAGAIG